LRSLLPGDGSFDRQLAAALRMGGAAQFEFHWEPGPLWLRVSASTVGGNLLVALADITEAKQAAARQRQQEEHARHAQKLEAIGTLAGGIAHDFNNVLTSIIGNAELAKLDLPPGDARADPFTEILRAADRARRLIRQIMTFTRQAEAKREVMRVSPL